MDKKVNRPEEEKRKGKPEDLPYNPEITSEDKQALNKKGRSMNKGQDKDLDENRERKADFTPDELDIPASNDTKPQDKSELVDEENMQYNKKGAREDHERAKDHPRSDKKI